MKNSILLFLTFLFFACQPKNSNNPDQSPETAGSKTTESLEPIEIDFPAMINNRSELWLSDIAKSIDYIPLETGEDFLIGEKGLKIRISGGYIFVGQDQVPVLMFDGQGHFIRKIGAIGRGPTEFNPDYLFFSEPEAKKLVFANAFRSSLIEYSWEGKFIREIKPKLKPMHFYPLKNDRFLIWSFKQESDSNGLYRWGICNGDGLLEKAFYEPKREFSLVGGIMSPLTYWGKDKLLINTWEDDFLLSLTEENLFEEVLTWNLGSMKMPFTAASDYNRYKREKNNYIRSVMAFETPTSWLISFYYQSGQQFGILDQTNGSLTIASNPAPEGLGILNNLDGGPPFWPALNIEGQDYFYQVFPAVELINWFDERSSSAGEIENVDAAKQLKLLLSKMKLTDNPVIRRIKIK